MVVGGRFGAFRREFFGKCALTPHTGRIYYAGVLLRAANSCDVRTPIGIFWASWALSGIMGPFALRMANVRAAHLRAPAD